MSNKVSVRAAKQAAVREDTRARKQLTGDAQPQLGAVTTIDSFQNLAHRLGVGADNVLSYGSYAFNPLTRNRVLLEWIHRGSWIGGQAIDIIPEDMTKNGIEIEGEMDPADVQHIERIATATDVWGQINETLQWGRLYGGAICVALIDGQDLRTPLNLDTVGTGQFKGLLTLDRWMVEPTLEDLVTEMGPHLGLPKYYRVNDSAPALRGRVVHYTRVMVRHTGIKLPYQQRLQENLWGISELERLYDRMLAFDTATMGAAQLVSKAFLRTLSVENLRDVVAAGGKPQAGLYSYVEMMRRFQGVEGITLIDAKDKFEAQAGALTGMTGIKEVLLSLAEQLGGALQMPLTRLLGQSPGGLNSDGDGEMQTYYSGIKRRQERDLRFGVNTIYHLIARSIGIKISDDVNISFCDLFEQSDDKKSDIATKTATAVTEAYDAGLINQQVAMKELRQSSRRTGLFSNITAEMIENADEEIQAPGIEELQAAMKAGGTEDGNNTPPNGQQQEKPVGAEKTPRKQLLQAT